MHDGGQSFLNARQIVLLQYLQLNFFVAAGLWIKMRSWRAQGVACCHSIMKVENRKRKSEARIDERLLRLFFYRILDVRLWISITVQYYGAQLQ
jgi:hypothetical protein